MNHGLSNNCEVKLEKILYDKSLSSIIQMWKKYIQIKIYHLHCKFFYAIWYTRQKHINTLENT